ncbi:MAG: NTP transferase domain-containing protein [Candidatus Bathyarchaeia archaeon]
MMALVMAGGRSIRMGLFEEKPLIKVNDETMIERVLKALSETKGLSKIAVVVSKYTPRTKEFLENLRLTTIEAPGKGYIYDMKFAIKKLKNDYRYFLVISADLPLINRRIIRKVLERYKKSKKPALTVMASAKDYEQLGIKTNYRILKNGKFLTPVGINIIDGYEIDKKLMDEEILLLDEVESLINVNTPEDLKIVKKVLKNKK